MNNKVKIKEYCKSLGLEAVGVCECRIFTECENFFQMRKEHGIENEFEESDLEKRINPFLYLEDGKAIVSIAFPYLFFESTPKKEEQDSAYFSKYTTRRDYHIVVSTYLKKICEFIEGLGGKAVYLVDSNALPERYIALQSGIGFVGKNNMLITKKYGSYVFLGEIITNLELERDEPIHSQCGDCEICLQSCPTKAIQKKKSNPNLCLSYITQKKEIEDVWFDHLNGRLFGCDTCQENCPFNKEIEYSGLKEFTPLEYMENVTADEIVHLDNPAFKEKYKNCSCGWRGKSILQRNALIYLYQRKQLDKVKLDCLKSPYVKGYYDRLLHKDNL